MSAGRRRQRAARPSCFPVFHSIIYESVFCSRRAALAIGNK